MPARRLGYEPRDARLPLLVTTSRQLRKAASGLPEVSEVARGGDREFLVAGTVFARLMPDGRVDLLCGAQNALRWGDRLSGAENLVQGGAPIGLRIPLGDINGMELNRLVYQSWLSHAPEHLTRAQRLADAGRVAAGPDALPGNLGRPATSALLTAGIATLSAASSWSARRLLALHGFGPKALRLLEAALKERGLELADDRAGSTSKPQSRTEREHS